MAREDPRTLAVRGSIAVVALLMLLFIWQATSAARALSDAKGYAVDLGEAISAGKVSRARSDLAAFNNDTTRAHHRTDGPMWWLAGKVPLVGPNLAAFSTVAEQSDIIADDALPRIVDVADRVRLDTFRPKNGRINLTAVRRSLPVLAGTDRVLAQSDAKVSAIRPGQLFGPLQGPVVEFQGRIHDAASAISAAHDAAELLPTMLSGDGAKRRYLLMVMNNAEVRSMVGMPGSFAVLETNRGKVTMVKQGAGKDIQPLDKPVLNVKPEVQAGFDSRVGDDMRDTAIIPDFPRVAQLAASIAGKRWDESFDGVVAVDPVSLGYVLGAVGKVELGGGVTIDQSNTASTLLNGIYLRFPTDGNAQDEAFKSAARRTFDALTSGRGNSVEAMRGLVRGVREGRILLWSRHRGEEARIHATGIAGPLTDPTQHKRPQVGVYVTDTTRGKIDYYLRMGTRVHPAACYEGDVQDLTVTTTLGSDAPQGGRPLPLSITGIGQYVPKGDLGVNVRLFAPPHGRILSVTVDGQQAPVGANSYRGRRFATVGRVLSPGESTVIVTQIRTGSSTPGDPLLRTTPGVQQNDDVVEPSACD